MLYVNVIIAGILITLAHYFGSKIESILPKDSAISLAAGISVSYIFLEMFPRVSVLGDFFVFIFVLLGFSSFYITEKIIYRHKASKKKKQEELHMEHSVSFFIYHFLIGIALASLFKISVISGVLFTVPVFFYSLIGTVSLENIHSKVRGKLPARITLSLSTFMGSLFALAYPIQELYYNGILGFVVGSMIFVVIKDSLPEGKRGSPAHFVAGMAIFSLLMIILWKYGL